MVLGHALRQHAHHLRLLLLDALGFRVICFSAGHNDVHRGKDLLQNCSNLTSCIVPWIRDSHLQDGTASRLCVFWGVASLQRVIIKGLAAQLPLGFGVAGGLFHPSIVADKKEDARICSI